MKFNMITGSVINTVEFYIQLNKGNVVMDAGSVQSKGRCVRGNLGFLQQEVFKWLEQ